MEMGALPSSARAQHLKRRAYEFKDPNKILIKIDPQTDHQTRVLFSTTDQQNQSPTTVQSPQMISNSIQVPVVLSGRNTNPEAFRTQRHLLPYQIKKLQSYHQEKQYNNAQLDRFLYPTNDSLELSKDSIKQLALKAAPGRHRAVDMSQLSYDQQKEFFRLDKDYNKTFVEKHRHKLVKTPN